MGDLTRMEMGGTELVTTGDSSGRPVEQYAASNGGGSVMGGVAEAQRIIAERIKWADADTDQLLTAIDAYIAARSKVGDYFSWPALFLPAGRSAFGGYCKQAKLDAARYLRAMVLHFRVVDKKAALPSGTSLDSITAIGERLGPLMNGELSGYFERYRDCSGTHYVRYQSATLTGTFEEIPASAAAAPASAVSP